MLTIEEFNEIIENRKDSIIFSKKDFFKSFLIDNKLYLNRLSPDNLFFIISKLEIINIDIHYSLDLSYKKIKDLYESSELNNDGMYVFNGCCVKEYVFNYLMLRYANENNDLDYFFKKMEYFYPNKSKFIDRLSGFYFIEDIVIDNDIKYTLKLSDMQLKEIQTTNKIGNTNLKNSILRQLVLMSVEREDISVTKDNYKDILEIKSYFTKKYKDSLFDSKILREVFVDINDKIVKNCKKLMNSQKENEREEQKNAIKESLIYLNAIVDKLKKIDYKNFDKTMIEIVKKGSIFNYFYFNKSFFYTYMKEADYNHSFEFVYERINRMSLFLGEEVSEQLGISLSLNGFDTLKSKITIEKIRENKYPIYSKKFLLFELLNEDHNLFMKALEDENNISFTGDIEITMLNNIQELILSGETLYKIILRLPNYDLFEDFDLLSIVLNNMDSDLNITGEGLDMLELKYKN